ncbi:MAG: NADH-quinone oxidoreductase subunit N, partial [Methylophagaceae bacterium]
MMFEVTNMAFALPEMFMLAMACVILLVVAFLGKTAAGPAYVLSQLTLAVTMILIYQAIGKTTGLTFDGTYIKDAFSDILKLAICGLNIVVLLYSSSYLKARGLFKGEYYVLAIFSTLGMVIMVSA